MIFKCVASGVIMLCPMSLFAQQASLLITHDYSHVASGGLVQENTSRALALIGLTFDVSEHHTVYAEGQAQRGDDGSEFSGDIQAYSNIDEEDFSKLYELWLEGDYEKSRIRFKFGLVDANTEFAYVDNAGEFINSSMGFSPTIAYLPTYPEPRPSLNLFIGLASSSNLGFGLYVDEDDELFIVSEWKTEFDKMLFKIGLWHQSGDVERFDQAGTEDGAIGYYAIAEGEASLGLAQSSNSGWYTQLGYTDKSVSAINIHFGVGLTFFDTFQRKGDAFGLGVTYVKTSQYLSSELNKDETSFELFYRAQVTENIAIKPDIQFIASPASSPDVKDALVLTFRTELSF